MAYPNFISAVLKTYRSLSFVFVYMPPEKWVKIKSIIFFSSSSSSRQI
jgi:hypothetical protein